MKNICLILSLTCSFWLSRDSAHAHQAKRSPESDVQVAARVNGDVVSRADVERLLANPVERRELVRESGIDESDSQGLERLAVRRLIGRRLIVQEASRRKIAVTDQELDQAIASLRRRFAELKDLGRWMKEQGLDDKSLFETVRNEMVAARVHAALVEGVRITDDHALQYYESHKHDLKVDEVRLQLMALRDEQTASEVLEALRKGENFGTLARDRSVGKRAARGGDTGWVDSATLWPPLRAAVSRMQPRQAHGPLQRDGQFLIVRLEDRRPGRTKTLAEARPEIERRLLPEKQRDVVQSWLQEQEKKSTIELVPQAE